MQRFLLGHAAGGDADALLDDCLGQLGDIPPQANFGFVYATDALVPALPAAFERLRAHTGIGHWAGTVGVGVCATAREYYDEPALALMLASFPEPAFRPLPLLRNGLEPLVERCGDWLPQDSFHFGILHGDPGNPATPGLIDALAAQTPGAFFVGGLTSSRSQNLQFADGIVSGGVSGVIFGSEIAVATGHTQGCTPIAERHRITACEQNILIELDGRPALDVFKEDIGEALARDLQRVGGYIFAGLPIAASDTGDYMVRNLVGLDVDQGLVAIGDLVTPGGEIMFCRRDGNSAREDMQRMLDDLRRRLPDRPRGAVYYSCLGRGRHQFGENSEELRFIRDQLGDFPLVGFFANGEIFHNRLYGYTGVLTVFC